MHILTVGQSPDPPRLWRALMLFRTPRTARNALARRHFHSVIKLFDSVPSFSQLPFFQRIIKYLYLKTCQNLEEVN